MNDQSARLSELSGSLAAGKKTIVVGGEPYGLHKLYGQDERREYLGAVLFAEDDCGNWIGQKLDDGAIVFVDHETDEMTALSLTLQSFIESLVSWEESVSPEVKVVSAWIDPNFLQEVGEDDA